MPAIHATPVPRYSCFLSEETGGGPDAAGLRVGTGVEVQLGSTPSHRLMQATPHRNRFLGGYPLVWVSHPVTGFAAPYWTPRSWGAALAQLRPGRPAPSLPAPMVPALRAVGALTGPSVPNDQSQEHAFGAAAEHFRTFSHATVSGLVPQAHLRALADYQRALVGSGQVSLGDEQCGRRYGMYNEPMARFLLHQLAGAVSRVVGKPVLPAYSYSLIYEAGAVLAPHIDREQCEYTVSLLIEGTAEGTWEPWPLWLKVAGKPVAVHQLPGDALVFAGRRLPHWRDRLPDGRTSTSLLLHYVDETFTGVLR
ncbi:hypothetical protein [Jatrophihabitans sp.]|uniref:hypothetical protein n=1 Tax=Jatrophihabitans sp. TaxID=1932789 RepID=UPI002BEFC3A4|nr:hypothetical protein [Jatrophihabitans sp.]